MVREKKLNLSRFKKGSQGLIEFAILIEQAEPHVAESIISKTREQDPEFLFEAMRRVVFFEELLYLDEGVLAEIVNAVTPKVLAYSLNGMPADFRKAIQRFLGPRELRQVKDEEESSGIAAGHAHGARRHILKTARALEAAGKIAFALSDCPRFHTRGGHAGSAAPPSRD